MSYDVLSLEIRHRDGSAYLACTYEGCYFEGIYSPVTFDQAIDHVINEHNELNVVFAVYVQSDMTEGRGPHNLHSLWPTRELAREVIKNKTGVMGSQPKRSHKDNTDCLGWECKKCWPHGGDWEIRLLRVNGPNDVKKYEDH